MLSETTCVFCKIRSGTLPGDFLHRDETCFVISDISPAAAVHLLVIPNEHFTHLENLSIQARDMLGHMVKVASEMADSAGIAQTGYRLVINQRNDAGQMVDHLHLHVLGGGKLGAMG